MTKTNEGLFTIYDGACKSGEYFNSDKLPRINGAGISQFWCPCDFTTDPKVVDAAGWSIKSDNTFTNQRPEMQELNRFGYLPDAFKHLFGWQTIQGKQRFVRHVWFRVGSSGHASWDSIMSIYTPDNHISVWYDRTGKNKDKNVTQNDPYVKKWLAMFNTSHKSQHPTNPYWQFKKQFPKLDENAGTYLQRVNDEFFPDVYCKPWRKYGTHSFKQLNENQITILNEDEGKVYRLTRATDIGEGSSNLLLITPRSMEQYYLHPTQNNKGEFCRISIDKIGRDYIYLDYGNGKPQQCDKSYLKYFWIIFSITDAKTDKKFEKLK